MAAAGVANFPQKAAAQSSAAPNPDARCGSRTTPTLRRAKTRALVEHVLDRANLRGRLTARGPRKFFIDGESVRVSVFCEILTKALEEAHIITRNGHRVGVSPMMLKRIRQFLARRCEVPDETTDDEFSCARAPARIARKLRPQIPGPKTTSEGELT